MSSGEFDRQAAVIAEQIPRLPEAERYAAASRGSANPAALVWLAEGLGLDGGCVVADLGAGLGGPAAWLADRYGCRVVALEPAAGSIEGAKRLFGLPSVLGRADVAPFRDDAVDVALLLEVTSVVDDAHATLAEACRLAPRLGLLDHCATGERAVTAGGSTFLPPAELLARAVEGGWEIDQSSAVQVPPPRTWAEAGDAVEAPADDDEDEVVAAIERGDIAPFMAVAHRRTG